MVDEKRKQYGQCFNHVYSSNGTNFTNPMFTAVFCVFVLPLNMYL